MNNLIFKFLPNKNLYKGGKFLIQSLNGNYSKMMIKVHKFQFTEVLTKTQKMRKIIEMEKKQMEGSEEDIKFLENKTFPLILHTQMVRLPIYLNVPFLIWLSPFSISYSCLALFSNYYMIFLTTFEATAFFSLGLNSFNLFTGKKMVNEEILQIRKITSKRLAPMIIFFSFLLLSSFLGYNYNNISSFGCLLASNLYLYIKLSYHITLYGLPKLIFEKRMKNILMNMLLIIIMATILWKNDKLVNNNIIYNI